METYEEKYKNLVKRLNKAREEKGVYTFNSVLDAVAPELKIDESEDERIRKEIKQFIRSRGMSLAQSKVDSWIAWLEKQGELTDIPADAVLDSNKDGLITDTIRCKIEKQGEQKHQYNSRPKYIGEEELLGEQKPAEWSEEDEENFARVDYACLKTYGGDSYSSGWLRKFLGIHKKWKPSDKQMNALEHYMNTLVCNEHKEILFGLYADLKKLKG